MFDGADREFVEIQPVAKHLQEAKLFLLHIQIRRGNFDGEGVGGLVQLRRENVRDKVENGIEAAIGTQMLATGLGRLDQILIVKIGENRELAYDVTYSGELLVADGPINRRHGDHDIDKGFVVIDSVGHSGWVS